MQPNKRKEIEAVSAASLVALRSQLIKQQQQQRTGQKPSLHRSKKSSKYVLEGTRNRGVDERDKCDRSAGHMLHHSSSSSVAPTAPSSEKLAESRAALERKAALYDRFTSGQYESNEIDKYEVDFLVKDRQQGQGAGPEKAQIQLPHIPGTSAMISQAMVDREEKRRRWEEEAHEAITQSNQHQDRLELIQGIALETHMERLKADIERADREQRDAERRHALKSEFLKRKRFQLKQKRQQSNNNNDNNNTNNSSDKNKKN